MKTVKLLLVILISQLAISQTEFSNGYQVGYIQGNNYGNAYNLSYQLTPLAPLPTLIESSFRDGYNRGLIESYSKRKQRTKSTYYYDDSYANYWTYRFNSWLYNYETDMMKMLNQPKKHFENKLR
tara:strand:+ start:1198 stop:1572 length:375 start_codon:yes stop_codon:yes gene_type:complete